MWFNKKLAQLSQPGLSEACYKRKAWYKRGALHQSNWSASAGWLHSSTTASAKVRVSKAHGQSKPNGRVVASLLLMVGLGLAGMPAQAQQHSAAVDNTPEDLPEYIQQKLFTAQQDSQQVAQQQTSTENVDATQSTSVHTSSVQTDSGHQGSLKDEVRKTAAATMGESTREQTHQLQADAHLTGEYQAAYYSLEQLNAGLPTLEKPVNLSTPLATLEFFQTAVLQKKFALAAYALNMNLIEQQKQSSHALELVKKLDFLLSEKSLYLFDDLPDRADGLIEPPLGSDSSINGIPRRSIKLGYIDYDARRVPIFLERVRVGDAAPVWVFSAQTVENIDMLYQQHKPAEFAKYLPGWLTVRVFGIALWEYLTLILFFTLTLGLGWVFSRATGALINCYADDETSDAEAADKAGRRIRSRQDGLPDLIDKVLVPLTFTISFSLMFALVSGAFPYVDAVASSTRPIVWVALIMVTLWLGIRVINFFANRYQDLQIESLADDNFHVARRRRTYVSIFRRIFIFVMIVGGFWIGLSEFTNIDGLGKTLLTSAGIAGAVIGIAAQPILGNIIAGVIVAVTQPVRIGDTVMLEGVWCTIEDLRYTYAVLLTWDERRLLVPMRYFVTEVLENWSHTNIHQSMVVYLYVDYGADIEQIRQKFIEVVKAHPCWDGESEPELLVTEVSETTIKLRGQLAGDNPYDAWTLECAVRESMLNYLYQQQKSYLPSERFILKGTE